jgi:hypothetical protein
LYDEGWWQGELQLEPGWQIFPLAAAQNLSRADAFWSARRLSRTAVVAIENTSGWTAYGRNPAVTADYRKILQYTSRRYDECIENLAWELRKSCRLEVPNFRLDVAALFWTLGDVPHAQLLRNTALIPPQQVFDYLVRRSLQVMHLDPALQEIWLGMKDRPPFSLRDHPELFVSINLKWAPICSPMEPYGGQHQVDLLGIGHDSPSWAYARAITEYFRSGVAGEAVQRLDLSHCLNSDALMAYAPEALHRMRSLLILTSDSAEPNQLPQAAKWRLLAEASCAIVEQRERNIRDTYDRTLDIPFYYLDRSNSSHLALAIELTERYREAGRSYWRHASPQVQRRSPEGDRVRGREQQCIAELRANRYLSLLPILPPGCARLQVAGSAPEDPDVVSQLSRKAPGRVAGLMRELDIIEQEKVAADPAYQASRVLRPTTIEEFSAALSPRLKKAPQGFGDQQDRGANHKAMRRVPGFRGGASIRAATSKVAWLARAVSGRVGHLGHSSPSTSPEGDSAARSLKPPER